MKFDSTALAQHILNTAATKATYAGADLPMLTAVKPLNALVLYNLKLRWEQEAAQLKSPFFDYQNEEVKAAQVRFLNILSQHIKLSASTATSLLADAITDYVQADTDYITFVANKLEVFANPAIPLPRLVELAKFAPANRAELEGIAKELKSFGKSEVLKGELQMNLVQLRNRNELAPSNTLAAALKEAYPNFAWQSEEPIASQAEPESEETSFFDSIELDEPIPAVQVQLEILPDMTAPTAIASTTAIQEHNEESASIPVSQVDEQASAFDPELESKLSVTPTPAPTPTQPAPTPRPSKLAEMPRALHLEQESEILAEKLHRTAPESSSLLNRISQAPVGTIAANISLIDKERFISQIFMGDRVAYSTAIFAIENAGTRQEAEQYIHNQMLAHLGQAPQPTLLQSFERVVLRKFSN